MLKLVFYTQDRPLKVRPAFPEESFALSCQWENKLDFIVGESSDFMMSWTSLLPDLEAEYAEALVSLVAARYPISEHHQELKKKCPEIIFHNQSDEWVFFGGSFNPWHKGHQSCLNLMPEDKTCLIVPDRNPHKEIRPLNPVTTVLEISTKAKFGRCQFLVPTFLMENRPNPTADWVEKLKENFPAKKISLLIGFDSFSTIKSWTRSQDLLPMLHTLYVVSRLEDDKDRHLALDEVHALNAGINVIFLGKHQFESLSSTEIRKKREV